MGLKSRLMGSGSPDYQEQIAGMTKVVIPVIFNDRFRGLGWINMNSQHQSFQA
jgi:hypothetical protein